MCSVALVRDNAFESEINTIVKTGHAGKLLPMIDNLLCFCEVDKKKLDLIVVGCGPGSFTGIRIGIATARGLSMSLDCPLAGISTLDALAYAAQPCHAPVMPVIDARKSEIFCALYDCDGTCTTPFMNIRPEKIAEYVKEETIFVGNGIDLYEEVFVSVLGNRFRKGPQALWYPRASVIAQMAVHRMAEGPLPQAAPIYVRPSDATLTLNSRSSG